MTDSVTDPREEQARHDRAHDVHTEEPTGRCLGVAAFDVGRCQPRDGAVEDDGVRGGVERQRPGACVTPGEFPNTHRRRGRRRTLGRRCRPPEDQRDNRRDRPDRQRETPGTEPEREGGCQCTPESRAREHHRRPDPRAEAGVRGHHGAHQGRYEAGDHRDSDPHEEYRHEEQCGESLDSAQAHTHREKHEPHRNRGARTDTPGNTRHSECEETHAEDRDRRQSTQGDLAPPGRFLDARQHRGNARQADSQRERDHCDHAHRDDDGRARRRGPGHRW